MKLTLSGYEKKTVNSSGGTLSVITISGDIELSFLGVDEIPLETGDQIPLGDVAKVSFQNIGDSEAVIDYIISSKVIDKKSQATKAEITNTNPIKVEMDRDVNIGAVNQDGDWVVDTKIANTNSHLGVITCAAGAATLLALADVTRKELRVNVDAEQAGGVFIGGAGIAANQGGFIDIGVTDYIPTQGALYAFNPNAEPVDVNLLSLGRV